MRYSFLRNQFSCLLLLSFLFLTHLAAANNGWDEIKVNDFVTAIREMRHKGVSMVIASQDPPSLPNEIIELSTIY